MQKIWGNKANSYSWPWLPASFGSRLGNLIVIDQEWHCYCQARPFNTTQRLLSSPSSLFSSLLARLRQLFLMTFKSLLLSLSLGLLY